MNAGDVLFFIDGGLTHGATAWKNPLPRRGILMKYSGREVHRSGGDLGAPTAANPASIISGVLFLVLQQAEVKTEASKLNGSLCHDDDSPSRGTLGRTS